MDYIDDDYDVQPRARLVPSGQSTAFSAYSSASPSLPHAAACVSAALLLLFAAYTILPLSDSLASLLLWFACSLLLAPFAPASSTGGHLSVGRGRLSVGRGRLLPSQEPVQERNPDTTTAPRRPRRHNPTPPAPKPSDPIAPSTQPQPPPHPSQPAAAAVSYGGEKEEDGGEWTDQEMELLRRQMVKHPAGEPQRWEKIGAAFGGRRSPESVIRAAKSGGAATGDSFEQFLRRRKPLDPRAEASGIAGEGEAVEGSWTAGDDRALLNALKAFPKEVGMRWEKVAAAVPGKTKAACVKRVAELKRDFRSSKAALEAGT